MTQRESCFICQLRARKAELEANPSAEGNLYESYCMQGFSRRAKCCARSLIAEIQSLYTP